jgi:hypothetical protein
VWIRPVREIIDPTDREQTEGPEEKAEGFLRRGARPGHGRSDQGMVSTPHTTDIPPGLRYVCLSFALEELLVQHRPGGEP